MIQPRPTPTDRPRKQRLDHRPRLIRNHSPLTHPTILADRHPQPLDQHALAAGNALDDAKTGAQQTDAQQLLDLLDSAEAHLDEARRVLESATEDAATEQLAAEAWGKGTGRDAAAGAPSPPSARAAGGGGSPSGPGSQAAKASQDQRVADVLKRKKGSIKNAPLGGGSPSWDDFSKMTMRDIEAGARANKPGYKTALKLLRDRRFNR